MFLPTTKSELDTLGWNSVDIILVTGDSYIDSPYIGIAVIGKMLLRAGFRVGVIAQPDIHSGTDITRLGEPELFWGVSSGSIDSMVANYTPLKKKRKKDDYTPGGINDRRPDRAVIVYSNLIRQYFKNTRPIVLGGIEASLRRLTHYDFWSDKLRRSILFDAKADFLLYGMCEKSAVHLAECLAAGRDVRNIRGLCYISKQKKEGYLELPSFDRSVKNMPAFIDMFTQFYHNNDPVSGSGLVQKQDSRYLIQNPPPAVMSRADLDDVYDLDFELDLHPFYKEMGGVKALDTIKFSICTHRGCYGGCNFCAIAVHQGRIVQWRSEASIIKEAKRLSNHSDFKGYIFDVGGPTANMYGFECRKKMDQGSCKNRQCLYPKICPQLNIDHGRQLKLLKKLRNIKKIKNVFIASGLRYDMIFADKKNGIPYLKEVICHHVSGQMKVAPEHTEEHVLEKMGKQDGNSLLQFRNMFNTLTKEAGKNQFLTYYLMAAHPGCTIYNMKNLKKFASKKLKIVPRQVQIFTPSPSTFSSLMYYSGTDPFTGEPVYVEKNIKRREKQKSILLK